MLIEDDDELAALTAEYLGQQGFAVLHAAQGEAGVDLLQARGAAIDLVLLDVMLPDLDGFEVLRRLRRSAADRVPVMMLTARGDTLDRIVGLELGADDYLAKPFHPRELKARMDAILRRSASSSEANASLPSPARSGESELATELTTERDAEQAAQTLSSGPLTLFSDAYRATLDGDDLHLTRIEFELLQHLMKARGRVLTREYLLDRLCGREFEVFDRSIDVHIYHLRQKLGDDARDPCFIKTVRAVGYLYVGF